MHEIEITTFGYLHDPAPAAHLTIDLRAHFRDPHVSPELRNLTARDTAVHEAVRTTPGILPLVHAAEHAVLAYLAGPSAGPVTVAVGCAGGRHRAATVGDLLATSLAETHGLAVALTHRDLDKPVVRRTPSRFVTFADRRTLAAAGGPAEPGTVLANPELLAVTDVRRLPVSELVFEHHYGNRVSVGALLEGTATARLLQVRPLGVPEPVHRGGGIEVYRPPMAGWQVVDEVPWSGLLGPRADEIALVSQLARTHLRGDPDASPGAARYYQLAHATAEAMDACLDAALTALAAAGIDARWWAAAVTCAYGHELVALAAHDLIGTVPDWTAAAYDTLTAPWRAARFGVDALAVPSTLRAWSEPFPGYAPTDVTPPELQPGEDLDDSVAEGWAEPHTDPAALPDVAVRQAVALIPFDLDAEGRPLNPTGRTGRTGRDLGRWGENAAADSIVVAGTGDNRRVLLIRRADTGAWAIPGGMVEDDETPEEAMLRELHEETGLDLTEETGLDLTEDPTVLACVHVDDPRETDHAWITTTVGLFRLPAPVTVTAADDATDAAWLPFTSMDALHKALPCNGGTLYAAHRPLLAAALQHLADA